MAGMENQDLFICIDHVGLAVRDLDEAIKFHSEVFGWRELHREVNEEQGVAEAIRTFVGAFESIARFFSRLAG